MRVSNEPFHLPVGLSDEYFPPSRQHLWLGLLIVLAVLSGLLALVTH